MNKKQEELLKRILEKPIGFECMTLRRGTTVIGDVHGNPIWKSIVAEHPKDKIVFLGDYCDPYEYYSSSELLTNLRKIIELKKKEPERIVLLLGNHDMHYLTDEIVRGTRYDYFIADKLRTLFNDNIELFQLAYQDGEKIYTHAGISDNWFNETFKGDPTKNIADQINNAVGEQRKALFAISRLRGGHDPYGGIFWADIDELGSPLQGYQQYVGHNRVPKQETYCPERGTSITFCDCLNGKC